MSYPRESFCGRFRELFSLRQRIRKLIRVQTDILNANKDLIRLNAKLKNELRQASDCPPCGNTGRVIQDGEEWECPFCDVESEES